MSQFTRRNKSIGTKTGRESRYARTRGGGITKGTVNLEKEDSHFHQEHRIYQDKIIYRSKMKQHLS